jgi:two-component system, OmpR family, alkaline phosphatase synthesis response regulator PhoP
MARILVAEDDAKQAELVRMYLEREGHAVSVVRDGRTALEQARQKRPDIVVLDVMMPGMDGYQVLELLRREHSELALKVVMLTARTSDADIWHGWTAGVDYYMSKPFDPEELLRFLHFLAGHAETPTATD